MNTILKEFRNHKNQLLRGILVETSNKDSVVLMTGGFERSGTTEKKFKLLADKLAEQKINSFRFDASDCGLSDGDFYDMTIKSMSQDLFLAHKFLVDCGYKKIFFVVHSLSACALALSLDKINVEKAILISPALNQKELLRLWFAQKNNKNKEINWNNFKDNYSENEFIHDLDFDLMTKVHKLNKKFRLENQDKDYSPNYLAINNRILLIHGDKDDKVPYESLNVNFPNKIIVEKGNHDLEQPEMVEQWLDKAVDFLKN